MEFKVCPRKIPLSEIRKRELQRCKKLGIVRAYSDSYYERKFTEDVTESLQVVGEYNKQVHNDLTINRKKKLLINFQRTRHLMSHILYLVQCLCDPAFFYTCEQMKVKRVWGC